MQKNFRNALNFTLTEGAVFIVVHNGSGRMMTCSTDAIGFPGGQKGTVTYNIRFGLAPGPQSGTSLMTSTEGAAISAETDPDFTRT
jgi:hypothetical protein